jgi:hydrogenase nickel incorporation protein HypB
MFHKADLVLISKVDLLPHLPEISLDRIVVSLQAVMPEPKYIAVSARTGAGIAEWVKWLHDQEPNQDARLERSRDARPERSRQLDHHA